MHQLPIEQQILLVAQIVALVALCARLWWVGLYKIYTWFFGYLVVELLQTLVPLFVPLNSPLYRDYYVASQALVICFCALVILELYSIILRGLAGIGKVSRRYIKLTLLLAILVSLLPSSLEKTSNTLTGYLFVFERLMMSSLFILILLIAGFLIYYPIPIGRNVFVYLVGFAVYFVATGTTVFIRNLGHYWGRPMSDLYMGVYFTSLALWLFALNRQGETKSVVVGHQWNPSDERRLLAQLEAINASLLRSARK